MLLAGRRSVVVSKNYPVINCVRHFNFIFSSSFGELKCTPSTSVGVSCVWLISPPLGGALSLPIIQNIKRS